MTTATITTEDLDLSFWTRKAQNAIRAASTINVDIICHPGGRDFDVVDSVDEWEAFETDSRDEAEEAARQRVDAIKRAGGWAVIRRRLW